MSRRGSARLCIVALFLGTIPLSGAAPLRVAFRDGCGKCYNNAEGSAHVFGDAGWWYEYDNMDCDVFNSCHGNSQSGSCSQYHQICGGGATMLERVGKAFASRDANGFRELLAGHPSELIYDPRSGTLAVLNCDRSVLKEIPVPETVRPSARTVNVANDDSPPA